MCGFIQRKKAASADADLSSLLGVSGIEHQAGQFNLMRHMSGMIIQRDGQIQSVDPIWWFICKVVENRLTPIPEATSFNARNLTLPRWAKALRSSRGLIFADTIGESIADKQGKKQYLMETKGIVLGTLFKEWNIAGSRQYSMAVITRDPHPRFKKYHDKSTPCFLPHDSSFLKTWLNPNIEMTSEIEHVLKTPRLYQDMTVTHVKTYKHADALAESVTLTAD